MRESFTSKVVDQASFLTHEFYVLMTFSKIKQGKHPNITNTFSKCFIYSVLPFSPAAVVVVSDIADQANDSLKHGVSVMCSSWHQKQTLELN